jgi:hypothetical protein
MIVMNEIIYFTLYLGYYNKYSSIVLKPMDKGDVQCPLFEERYAIS